MKSKATILSTIVFAGFAGWWIILNLTGQGAGAQASLFSDTYWIMAAVGGIVGIEVARAWGGLKALLGRSIYLFAFGLLAQVFGQVIYTYYAYIKNIDAPYPSLGDAGFFGSVLLYIVAAWLLAKTAGAKFALRSLTSKLQVLVIPVILLGGSYAFFLKDYQLDWTNPVKVILDFGYPLGQAFYIAMGILTFTLSRKYLGGVMRQAIILLLSALAIQYVADFSFLYTNNAGTWKPGGWNDAIYLLAYYVMTLALLNFRSVYRGMKSS